MCVEAFDVAGNKNFIIKDLRSLFENITSPFQNISDDFDFEIYNGNETEFFDFSEEEEYEDETQRQNTTQNKSESYEDEEKEEDKKGSIYYIIFGLILLIVFIFLGYYIYNKKHKEKLENKFGGFKGGF